MSVPTTPSRRALGLAATGAASLVLATLAPGLPSSAAAAPGPRANDVGIQGEHRAHQDRDRRGAAGPTEAQRAAAKGQTRFGPLGTPAVVVDPAAPLATGLGADPEAAARAYLSREQALFGLTPEQVARLELVAVHPIGRGAAVLLRQVFGDLRTAQDGLVAVGVVDGAVHSDRKSVV